MCEPVAMPRARPWPVLWAVLLGVAVLAAQTAGAPQTASAAGPFAAFTAPAPGSTAFVGARFRLGWTESAPLIAPIVARRVVEYGGSLPATGGCAKAGFSVRWTNTSANPVARFQISDLASGTCYYWVVTLTDVNGHKASARSGYVLAKPASDPSVGITFPAPGAMSDAAFPSYTITWTEKASAGVAKRIVTEQSAMAVGRSCAGATWSTSRTFSPTAASLAVSGLISGWCYQYTVALWDPRGGLAAAVSGVLLVTTVPRPCAYGDVPTTDRAYSDWSSTLLDTTYRLPSTYVPPDLRYTTGISHVSGRFRIRNVAYADLKALAGAARAAGAAINLTSTFRGYASQQATYDYYVRSLGAVGGLLRAARPGHSEHQLGLTIDVMGFDGVSPSNFTDWTVSKAGAWMRDNAWRYGWLMSYPKASSPAITCYAYEPWHYRYVGRTVAKAVHDAGLTLREYLWLHRSIAPGA
jgi:LAS superfamily LD-carboxypeptidase LdcB